MVHKTQQFLAESTKSFKDLYESQYSIFPTTLVFCALLSAFRLKAKYDLEKVNYYGDSVYFNTSHLAEMRSQMKSYRTDVLSLHSANKIEILNSEVKGNNIEITFSFENYFQPYFLDLSLEDYFLALHDGTRHPILDVCDTLDQVTYETGCQTNSFDTAHENTAYFTDAIDDWDSEEIIKEVVLFIMVKQLCSVKGVNNKIIAL